MEGEDYSSVTADYLLKKMKQDKSVVAITSATPTVLGFTKDKRDEAGKQFMDVGIAEETAAAIASGIAVNGGRRYGVFTALSYSVHMIRFHRIYVSTTVLQL